MGEIGAPRRSPTHGKELLELEELKTADEELSQSEQDATLEGVVWRKLDRCVIPLVTIFFLLANLDRTNIGNARVAGLQKSLHISNYQYTMALTVTYIPYLAVQLPVSLLLKYVGPNIILPSMITMWGVVTITHGLVTNYSQLLVCRFFLGLVEGGLLPGIVLYLSLFYPRDRLQIRVAAFHTSASLSGAFSGLLAAAIDLMNGKGGKLGWEWIFIMEGILTVVFGVTSFFLFPRSPEKARFLTAQECAYVVSTLKKAGSVSENDEEDSFSWTEVGRLVKSPHSWLLSVMFFLAGTILFGLSYFEPTIVADLGYAGNMAQLMSVPPFAVAFVSSLISAALSDHYHCRGFMVILFSSLKAIGFSVFYASPSNHVRYGALFLCVTGTYCTSPALITWMANNSSPHVRRATAAAVSFTMSGLGGVLAIWLLGSLSPAPKYTLATITFIVMSVTIAVLATINLVYLWRANRSKAKKRQRVRKEEESEGLGDESAWFIYSL